MQFIYIVMLPGSRKGDKSCEVLHSTLRGHWKCLKAETKQLSAIRNGFEQLKRLAS